MRSIVRNVVTEIKAELRMTSYYLRLPRTLVSIVMQRLRLDLPFMAEYAARFHATTVRAELVCRVVDTL